MVKAKALSLVKWCFDRISKCTSVLQIMRNFPPTRNMTRIYVGIARTEVCEAFTFLIENIRGVFGKYVDKFNRMRIKYTRQMEFCINEYQLLNIKYDQYENLTLLNDLYNGHKMG